MSPADSHESLSRSPLAGAFFLPCYGSQGAQRSRDEGVEIVHLRSKVLFDLFELFAGGARIGGRELRACICWWSCSARCVSAERRWTVLSSSATEWTRSRASSTTRSAATRSLSANGSARRGPDDGSIPLGTASQRRPQSADPGSSCEGSATRSRRGCDRVQLHVEPDHRSAATHRGDRPCGVRCGSVHDTFGESDDPGLVGIGVRRPMEHRARAGDCRVVTRGQRRPGREPSPPGQ